jgi:transcriptional regulator with GAF, ATPase, and Fis domain
MLPEGESFKGWGAPMEFNFENIIGKSKAIRDVLEMVKKVAHTQATVLITGDSGTGKELVALAIHGHSDRRTNCSAGELRRVAGDFAGEPALRPYEGVVYGAFANQEGLFEKARAEPSSSMRSGRFPSTCK